MSQILVLTAECKKCRHRSEALIMQQDHGDFSNIWDIVCSNCEERTDHRVFSLKNYDLLDFIQRGSVSV